MFGIQVRVVRAAPFIKGEYCETSIIFILGGATRQNEWRTSSQLGARRDAEPSSRRPHYGTIGRTRRPLLVLAGSLSGCSTSFRGRKDWLELSSAEGGFGGALRRRCVLREPSGPSAARHARLRVDHSRRRP